MAGFTGEMVALFTIGVRKIRDDQAVQSASSGVVVTVVLRILQKYSMSGRRPYQSGGEGILKSSSTLRITFTPGPSLLKGETCSWYWVVPAGGVHVRSAPKPVSVTPA